MRSHLEPYLVHSLEVMMYWIPFTDGQLQTVRFLFILVANKSCMNIIENDRYNKLTDLTPLTCVDVCKH